ncbi:hypothetical protein GCL60_05570 [Silvanigrella paludirubra]|uniref:Uncharacterized protein n=1 Tax=Silvanigrella paludirubra TaxID=2499159 RepID=A0A6N6VUJ1_9BACT|nr:hypothetical protein [Silvanigrella paludirubra]KAB8039731.1 hypothetical protein GCL60_05570 [Silvanigrella paludirubra]
MFRSRSPMVRKTDKMTSFVTVLSRYIIFSSIFWVLFSIICFMILYTPFYGDKSKLYFFSSLHLSILFLSVFIGILIFSALLGTIISLPSILIKILMKIRVEKKSRKGQKPVILIYLSTYFPILICISSNLIVLLISTSTAPQQMRKWFNNDFNLYKVQLKIFNDLFEVKTSDIYSKWKSVGTNLKKESKFIFLLPRNLLMYKNSFIETRKILTKENNWLLYSPTKEALTASILGEAYFADEKLFLPAPIQTSNDANIENNKKTKNFIGINGKNLLNFNNIFHKDSLNIQINNNWFNIFLNRIAISQPQILLFFRIRIISPIFYAWNWDTLTNSNSYLLYSYVNQLSKTDKKKENFVFFLTEMEGSKDNSFFKSIEWPENITKEEFEKNLKKIDLYLSKAIKALKDSGQENILVMPYKQNDNNIENGIGFSNLDFKEQLLNSEIINQDFINNTPIQSCNPIAINFNLKNNKISNHQVNYFLLDTLNSKYDNFPIIKKDYLLAIKNEIRYGVICQSPKKYTYLTFKKDDFFNKEKIYYKPNNKNIYQQLFIQYDKKTKKIENDNNLTTKITKNEINLNEFFKQFDIYKINNDQSITYSDLTDFEKEQFIKVYGVEVKDKFQSYINFLIK